MPHIDRILMAEKRARDDASKYVDINLVRQRRVNESVVNFAARYLQPGDVVLDACAGPEGSYLASARRGYRWCGNDISTRFARVLQGTGANTLISDFANAPFGDASASAVLFVYALENINYPGKAIAEAGRVLRPGGVAVYAEPGLSWFVGTIVSGYILEKDKGFAERLGGSCTTGKVEEFFSKKPYTRDEYAEFCIENALQTTPSKLRSDIFSLVDPARPKAAKRLAGAVVQNRYFSAVDESFKRNGLDIVKGGILVAASIPNDWYVSSVHEIKDPLEWTSEVWKARRLSGVLDGRISSEVRVSPQKNICPVVIAQKPAS